MSKLILLQKPKCQVKAVLFGDALVIVPPGPFMLLFAELAIRNTWMIEVMYQRRKDTEEVMRLVHNNIMDGSAYQANCVIGSRIPFVFSVPLARSPLSCSPSNCGAFIRDRSLLTLIVT
jgi:hypothetical protein